MFCSQCGTSMMDSANFCSSCGSKVEDNSAFKTIESFDPVAHAFEVVFGGRWRNTDEVTRYADENFVEINASANSKDPEALLKLSLIYGAYEFNFRSAPGVAELALEQAKKGMLPLARYWFALGFSQRQVDDVEKSQDSLEKALGLGFGPAALHLGLLAFDFRRDLRTAVHYFKLGRDKFAEPWCGYNLKTLEQEPGVFTAAFTLEDGSIDIVSISENPGGFGPMPR